MLLVKNDDRVDQKQLLAELLSPFWKTFFNLAEPFRTK